MRSLGKNKAKSPQIAGSENKVYPDFILTGPGKQRHQWGSDG
jgi:hypothetical protein